MTLIYKGILLLLGILGLYWVSRPSLKTSQNHGYFRFFAWVTMLLLFLLNMNEWFTDPFCLRQIVAWFFLGISILLVYLGALAFRREGKITGERQEEALLGFENTTQLITTGVYHYIRHPLYSSLLFLCWGIFLKRISWPGFLLAIVATIFLVATARIEEQENIRYFGDAYRTYMKASKMMIPYLF